MTTSLTAQDEEHLRILTILHYVMAGLMTLFACFPIIHLTMGAALVFAPAAFPDSKTGEGPPAFIGWFFMAFAAAWIVAGLSMVACIIAAARCLAQRRRRVFCMVVAGLMSAMCVPLGTALGIFTIIVLARPSVTQAFDGVHA